MKKLLLILFSLFLTIYSTYSQTIPTNSNNSLTFDKIELKILTKIVGEITGKNFITPGELVGNVSLFFPENISNEELYESYLTTLESFGYSVIEKNAIE